MYANVCVLELEEMEFIYTKRWDGDWRERIAKRINH